MRIWKDLRAHCVSQGGVVCAAVEPTKHQRELRITELPSADLDGGFHVVAQNEERDGEIKLLLGQK